MKTITPTELRKGLFTALDRALTGEGVLVRTRRGHVVLRRAGRAALFGNSTKPKIPGHIRHNLIDADRALREHIRWPSD